MKTVRWVSLEEGRVHYALSGEVHVGTVMCPDYAPQGEVWIWFTRGFEPVLKRQSRGETKTVDAGKGAFERVWNGWLKSAGLVPKPGTGDEQKSG